MYTNILRLLVSNKRGIYRNCEHKSAANEIMTKMPLLYCPKAYVGDQANMWGLWNTPLVFVCVGFNSEG